MNFDINGFYFEDNFIPYQAISYIGKILCEKNQNYADFIMIIELVSGKVIEISKNTLYSSSKETSEKEYEKMFGEMTTMRKNLINNFNKWNEKIKE